MVNTTLGKVENIEEVLKGEFAVVAEWQQKGILAHIFVKEAAGGVQVAITSIKGPHR